MIVGVGSAKALERGKFRIEKCQVDLPKNGKRDGKKEKH
jgi:hypothetical protein